MENYAKPLVLVIDDEAEVLGQVATVLNGAGYVCHCCSTADAALEFARSTPPQLIISDINLHGHSGLRTVRADQAGSALVEVPVMFLSGAQIPDIIRRSHAVGGSYYLRNRLIPRCSWNCCKRPSGCPTWPAATCVGRRQWPASLDRPRSKTRATVGFAKQVGLCADTTVWKGPAPGDTLDSPFVAIDLGERQHGRDGVGNADRPCGQRMPTASVQIPGRKSRLPGCS